MARYCNHCGAALGADRAELDEHGRPKLYADTAHPISPAGREAVATAVIAAYRAELASRRATA